MKISTRARHVLTDALVRASRSPTTAVAGEVRYVLDEMTPGKQTIAIFHALRYCFPAIEPGPLLVYRMLMTMNNCGDKTAREICKAFGFEMPDEKPHTCRCGTCGRTL